MLEVLDLFISLLGVVPSHLTFTERCCFANQTIM